MVAGYKNTDKENLQNISPGMLSGLMFIFTNLDNSLYNDARKEIIGGSPVHNRPSTHYFGHFVREGFN